MKKGVPCIVGRQDPAAQATIEMIAREVGAPLHCADQDWSARLENGRLVFEDDDGLLDLAPPALVGRHQIDNAGVAVAALRRLGLDEAACDAAMREASWPGRLMRLKTGPLVEAAHDAIALWLDGGHNPAAGAAVAAHFGELEERAPAPLYLICGMINSKDPDGFLAPFVGLARRLYAVPIPGEPNALSAEEVAEAAVRVGLSAQTAGSVDGALRAIHSAVDAEQDFDASRVLICGSLYLAGRVLRNNG